MKLKRIAASVLACTMSMTLFGCELVSVNKERDMAQVIVLVGDKNYSKEVVGGMVNSVLSMYGVDQADSKVYDEYRIEMAESFASQKAFQYYAVQNGYLDKLTEEDNKEIEESFNETKKYYEEEIYEEVKKELGYTGEEGAPEFTDAAKVKVEKKTAQRQKEYLLGLGVTTLEEYKEDLREQQAAANYTAHLESTVTVSDEEVLAKYNSLLAEQKSSFESNPASYIENSGSTAVYTPSGLRRVKQVLIKISDDEANRISALEKEVESMESGEAKTNKQSELDILKKDAYGKIEAKAKDVLSKAKSGADFDSLIAQYSEDEGAKINPDGYLMHTHASNLYEENFQLEGMALEKVGDISDLVQTSYGYHILMYASDVQGGEIAFEKVKDEILEQTLEEKKSKVVSDKTTEIYDNYKAEGIVKVYADRMKTASVPGK